MYNIIYTCTQPSGRRVTRRFPSTATRYIYMYIYIRTVGQLEYQRRRRLALGRLLQHLAHRHTDTQM